MIRAMQKITLKLRDLVAARLVLRRSSTANRQALACLRGRPRLVDVLGVVFEGARPGQNARLKREAVQARSTTRRRAAEQELAAACRQQTSPSPRGALREKEIEAARETPPRGPEERRPEPPAGDATFTTSASRSSTRPTRARSPPRRATR